MGLLTPRVLVGNPDQFLKVHGLMPLNHIFLEKHSTHVDVKDIRSMNFYDQMMNSAFPLMPDSWDLKSLKWFATGPT